MDIKGIAVKDMSLPAMDYQEQTPIVICAQKGDKNTRVLRISITDACGIMDLFRFNKARFNAKFEDGTSVHYMCTIDYENNLIIAPIDGAVTKNEGSVSCDVTLWKHEENRDQLIFTTKCFYLIVKDSNIESVDFENGSNYNVLLDLIGTVTNMHDDIYVAESSRTENENQRISNESSRIVAENNRDEREEIRISAENDRVNAEEERVRDEATRKSMETTRSINETQRKAEDNMRKTAEKNRVNAEYIRDSSETKRYNAEVARVAAEKDRNSNEALRESKENARKESELNRATAEETRIEKEAIREKAEAQRKNAEVERSASEKSRIATETTRINAEKSRVENENARNENEQQRIALASELQKRLLPINNSKANQVGRARLEIDKATGNLVAKELKGEKGDKGEVGPANELSIGIVTKGDEPIAELVGEAGNQILNLTLPKGDKGNDGVCHTISAGYYALNINKEGHLILTYADGDTPPDFKINEEGHLILTI